MNTTQKQFSTVLGVQCTNVAHLLPRNLLQNFKTLLIFVPSLKQNSFVLPLKVGRE